MSQIFIRTKNRRFKTSKDLYGIFFEDINRVGDGGLYPEMIRNRSFEDSIVPDGCEAVDGGRYFITPTGYKCAFNNGEGRTVGVKRRLRLQFPAGMYPEKKEILR